MAELPRQSVTITRDEVLAAVVRMTASARANRNPSEFTAYGIVHELTGDEGDALAFDDWQDVMRTVNEHLAELLRRGALASCIIWWLK